MKYSIAKNDDLYNRLRNHLRNRLDVRLYESLREI